MIVVFGSINMDVVMPVDYMPRLGDTVLCPQYRKIPGGKGANQAVAAAKAGSNVKFFGAVGKDEFGLDAVMELKDSNVDLTGLYVVPGMHTGFANVCVTPNGDNMIVVASGANLCAKQEFIPDFLLDKANTVLTQMETNIQENWDLIKRAKKYGARTIVNLAPAREIPIDALENIDVLIMNQLEANTTALNMGFDVVSPSVTAMRLAANFGMTCVVTMGGDGAIACSRDGMWQVKAMEVEAKDTTAAGDAFVGIFASSLDAGLDVPNALRRAAVGSGLACCEMGAQSSLPIKAKIEDNLNLVAMPKRISI